MSFFQGNSNNPFFPGIQYVPGSGYVQALSSTQPTQTQSLAGDADVAMISGLGGLGQTPLAPNNSPPGPLDGLKRIPPIVWLLVVAVLIWWFLKQKKE